MTAMRLPWPLRAPAERAMADFLAPPNDGRGAAPVDFATPAGEPALVPADSLSWVLFKNPVAVFVGGVAAVILELAEPRVREGVWTRTSFRADPLTRVKRTGLAAMVTVYGARSSAEAMIAKVDALHARIEGLTPSGERYRASDPELLVWVHATAAFGFAEAYHAWVRPLTREERDRLWTEGRAAARLYGAVGAPASEAEREALFERTAPRLERSDVVLEFLDLIAEAALLPGLARPLQRPLVKAAVAIIPDWARTTLALGRAWLPSAAERGLVRLAAATAERVVIEASPAAQACRRLGLPEDWLWRA
jgi:uncharacterized protein (DUF2236 family)